MTMKQQESQIENHPNRQSSKSTALYMDFPEYQTWQTTKPALQKALDTLGAQGGGRLVLSTSAQGIESGTLQLPSGVTLEITSGSILYAALEKEAYQGSTFEALIESKDAIGVGITGLGTIHGRGLDFMEEDLGYIYKPKFWRPRLICFFGCTQVQVTQITLKDGAYWTLHPIGCTNILIDGITIDSDLKIPNCDGIDPDRCQDVRIANCSITCADDCIVLKTTKYFPQYGPCERITVTNCNLVSTSAALKIGTESVADFRDVIFTNCTITRSSRGIALQLRDQGSIDGVIISNVVIETRLFEDHWWGKAEPIYITALPRYSVEGEQLPEWNPTGTLGTIRNVMISNVQARGENGIVMYGITRPDGTCSVEHITLDTIQLDVKKTSKWPAGRRDLRPCDAWGPKFRDPSADPGLQTLPHSGLSVEGVKDLRVSNMKIQWKVSGQPGYGDPLYLSENDGVRLRDVEIS
jgi:hypothetical protein